MLPRDYTRLGAEGGPPAPSRGSQQGGQTLLFNLIQFSPGHPPWAGRREQGPKGADKQGERKVNFTKVCDRTEMAKAVLEYLG